ncbi:hypothetical protein WMY93_011363 [Mugilogobius chulae]|uniref:Uncharacterized protein n=1 Tax=Mugilogobius chulae TaxID=88201 RepID=A0AAW0P5T2_9GOBI
MWTDAKSEHPNTLIDFNELKDYQNHRLAVVSWLVADFYCEFATDQEHNSHVLSAVKLLDRYVIRRFMLACVSLEYKMYSVDSYISLQQIHMRNDWTNKVYADEQNTPILYTVSTVDGIVQEEKKIISTLQGNLFGGQDHDLFFILSYLLLDLANLHKRNRIKVDHALNEQVTDEAVKYFWRTLLNIKLLPHDRWKCIVVCCLLGVVRVCDIKPRQMSSLRHDLISLLDKLKPGDLTMQQLVDLELLFTTANECVPERFSSDCIQLLRGNVNIYTKSFHLVLNSSRLGNTGVPPFCSPIRAEDISSHSSRQNSRVVTFLSAMGSCTKTLQVTLQEDGFCIATGPQDSGIAYPCQVNPFAPVILNSPVALHLHCPALFPQQVLKIHAEHLGHFLALQNVPPISQEYESVLFQSLCSLFTQDRVISLYKENLTAHDNQDPAFYHLSVFRADNNDQNKARERISLIWKLLELFDLNELGSEFIYTPGEEPQHMIFLYLIQLLVVFVSSFLPEKDLATIMSVASAPFLEANFCDPLCAATILKPMFIPYFDNVRKPGSTKREYHLGRYCLFKGYAIDNEESSSAQSWDSINWSHSNLEARVKGPQLRESQTNKLWFVAPQSGDRMDMVSQGGLRMMGGQTGEKPMKICQYLMSDNILAYVQCVVFGTIANMLPCHIHSEFTEDVMSAIDYSMSRFAQELSRQSLNFLEEQQQCIIENCLDITGVGFAGQDKGPTLLYGKVFTGPEEMRPIKDPSRRGVFTTVMLGVSDKTLVRNMLKSALKTSVERSDLKRFLTTRHKPVAIDMTTSDMYFFARYHHRFNAGEFTEICCVRPMNDPQYNVHIHKESLDKDSKYQLTVCHGALPFCVVTLAMTIRQAVMMVMGLLSAELARTMYRKGGATDSALSKVIDCLKSLGKFKCKEDNANMFQATFGDALKLTGPAFSNPGKARVNYDVLQSMEWLQANDTGIPSDITVGLNKIGDVKTEVRTIMQKNNLSYNRVLFMGPFGKMTFKTFFANPDYTLDTPLMARSTIRIFAGENIFGGVKLSKVGCYYPVMVYSNSCINTSQYPGRKNLNIEEKVTLNKLVEKIKKLVSGVRPRIDFDRIRMMAPELKQDQLESLVSTLEKEAKIEVLGQRSFATCQPAEANEVGLWGKQSTMGSNDCGDYNDDDDYDKEEETTNKRRLPGVPAALLPKKLRNEEIDDEQIFTEFDTSDPDDFLNNCC